MFHFQAIVVTLWLVYSPPSSAQFFVEGSNHSTGDMFVQALEVGDVNGDGLLDVVVGGHEYDDLEAFEGRESLFNTFRIGSPPLLFLNNGMHSPFSGVEGTPIGDGERTVGALALGDVDGDGDMDLVVAGWKAEESDEPIYHHQELPQLINVGVTIRLFLNNGTDDPFANVAGQDLAPDEALGVALALFDADGDGDLDVIAAMLAPPSAAGTPRIQ